MGQQVYRNKNTYLKRCDKCGRLSHYIYRMQLGNLSYNFDSGMCADAARQEYEDKIKKGISPSNLEPIEDGGEFSE